MRSIRVPALAALFAAACASLVSSAPLPKAESGTKDHSGRFSFVAYDSFDGKLSLNWKVVRPDASRVSLKKVPGALVITTQRGTIHGKEKEDAFSEGTRAKNLYLIDNPLAKDVDWQVTTCVSGFSPQTSYQQAGLIVYDDDDNYLKWGYEYNWPQNGGQHFCLVRETEANPAHTYVEASQNLKKFWVRLTKRRDRYEYAWSADGTEWKVGGDAAWGSGHPKRMGILAKNGGNKEAGELDAAFEFFELRAPAPK